MLVSIYVCFTNFRFYVHSIVNRKYTSRSAPDQKVYSRASSLRVAQSGLDDSNAVDIITSAGEAIIVERNIWK